MPKPIIAPTKTEEQKSTSASPRSPRTLSEDTFKKYDQEFKNWKKTGKYSDGFNSWANKNDLDLYKSIKSGSGKSALSNGKYYYLDNDTYDKYGKEFSNWKNTSRYSSDFANWKNDDDLNAYKAIRNSRSKDDNAFDDFRHSLNDDILKTVKDKYRSQFGDKYYYDITDPDDMARMNAGQMPKYLESKYKANDPYDRWLYENGLPYSSVFNDMYSDAVNDYNENRQKEFAKKKEENDKAVAKATAEAQEEQRYRTMEADFRNQLYKNISELQGNADLTDDEVWRGAIADLYESDPEKWQELIANFDYKSGTDELVPGSKEYFAEVTKKKKNAHAFTVTDLMKEYDGLIEKAQAEYIASLPPEQQEEATSALEDQKIQEKQLSLTQQLRQIDWEITRLGASGWNPNTKRMKELTDQRREIVAQLEASNAEKNEKRRADLNEKLLQAETGTSSEDVEKELTDIAKKLAGYRQADGTYRETEESKALIARKDELEKYYTLTNTAGRSLQAVNGFIAENGGTDEIADTSKWSAKARHQYKVLTGQVKNGSKLASLATPEEIAGANAAAAMGEDAFNTYLDDLETVLKYRRTLERTEEFEAFAQQDDVGASLASVGANVLGAVEGLGNIIGNAGNITRNLGVGQGNAVDIAYAGYMTAASKEIRNTVSEEIIANNSDQSFLPGISTGQIYSFLYQSGMSMLDSAVRLPLGSAGLAIAGLSAADSTILEQLENGATTREAMTLGVIAGMAEIVTEKVSLEQLLKPKAAGTLKQFLRETLKQSGVEASEEIFSECINILAEAITLEDNDLSWKGIMNRIIESGLGGFVSGIGFGAAGMGAQYARSGRFQDRANVKLGKQLTTDLLGENGRTGFFGRTGEVSKFRFEFIKAVTHSGLSNETQTNLTNLMDQMADDYGFIGTKDGQRIASELKTLVENESGNHQAMVAQMQEQEIQNQQKLTQMLDGLTNLADQARGMTNDPGGHSAVYNQFLQASDEYQNEQRKVETDEKVQNLKLEEAERKSEQKIQDAIEKTAQEYKEVSATIAETEAGQQLADLEQQLLNEEASASDTEYIKGMSEDAIEDAKVTAMENGDGRTFNLLDEMLEAKKSGDDNRISQFAEQNPDIVEMMWNSELGSALENAPAPDSAIEQTVKANKPSVNGYADAINNIENVRRAIQNERQQRNNGRNAQTEQTGTENGTVRDNEGRQNADQAEQTDIRRDSEITQNAQEVNRIAAPWTENESNGASNIEKLYRQNGIHLRVNQVKTEDLSPAYSSAVSAANNFLGNKDGVVLYTQTRESDDYVLHGQCYNGKPMVKYTGSDSDIAYLYHENGHAKPQYLQLVRDALGDQYRKILDKYIETAPESQSDYSRDEMSEELACDLFGLFGMHQVFGAEANGNEYISEKQLQRMFDALDDAWSDTAFTESNESVRQLGTDEGYSLSNREVNAVEDKMMSDQYNDVLAPSDDGQQRFSMRTIMHSAGLDMQRKNGAFTVTKNGKNVDKISVRDLEGTQIGAIINQAVDRGFISNKDAKIEKEFMRDLVNMMIRNKDADMVWAFAGSQVFSAITNNADAQYSKTVDFTTICRKTQALITAMSERMVELQRGLTDDEILQLQDELAQRGEAVPCPVCYVFSRWVGIGGVLERIKNYQTKYADINVAKAALENHTDPDAETWLKNVRLQKDYEKHGEVPLNILFDLNEGGTFASQYPLAWKYRTTRGPALGKAMTPYAEMNVGDVVQGMRKSPKKILKGESSPFAVVDGEKFGPNALKELLRSENTMRQQNLLGGLRYQSTSDFRTDYALDYLLSFFDVQAVGGKIQTYSKQPDGARLLASVGADVNLSVMPKGKGWKLENGKEVLDTSSVTGMDFKTAVNLKNQFDNVQLIMVGINDDHIRISLANSDIGFVIPYHASGGKVEFITAMARNLGENVQIEYYQDYADCQTDAVNPNATQEQKDAYDLRMRILMGKAKTLTEADQAILDNNPILQNLYNRFYVEGVDAECYGVKLKKSQAATIMPFEYWDTNSTLETANENGKTFVQYCESLGLIPRFSGKKVANGKIYNLDHGNFVDLDGYWKTLIDRPMYNRDGSYHVQKDINVTGVTSDMLSEEPNLQFSNRDIKQLDNDYMAAVNNGDTETAQRMVDEAAKQNGYNVQVYRGDSVSHNVFDTSLGNGSTQYGPGTYFTDGKYYADEWAAERAGESPSDIENGYTGKYYINTTDFFHDGNVDTSTEQWNNVADALRELGATDRDIRLAANWGFTGIAKVLQNVGVLPEGNFVSSSWKSAPSVNEILRNAGYKGIVGDFYDAKQYVIFDPSQAKSADPITYDDNYEVIPLSQRFNRSESDNRLSSRAIPSMSKRSEDVAKQAEALFKSGTSLTDYFNSGNYDNAVAAQLRNLMLKNGQDVGGKLSEQEVSKIIADAFNWKKGNLYAFKAPVRIFQDVGKWHDAKSKNAADYSRAVALNMQADEYYSDKYYSYMQQQLANENVFKQGVLDKINEIDPSESDAILAQLIGEKIITPDMARNAVMDKKHILIPIGNGAMVLDKKGRVRYMADQQSLLLFSDDVLKKAAERARKINEIRNDDKPGKDERIKEVQRSGSGPEETMGVFHLERNGDNYRIVNENGTTVFEMDGENAFSDKATQLADTLSAIYGSMYDSVQSTLVENGYAPIGHIENYFPHFTQAREGVAGMIDYLKSEDLPVGIAGLTPDFSPGKPWARNLLERLGNKTDYNAVRGFEGYLNGVSDVIYMTPVIQRFRQLESALRTGMASKTAEQQNVNEANTNFLRWLHDYTNQLANKKPMVDRGVEETFGRKVYTLPTKLSGWIGTAYIGANLRTALTNLASFAQGTGQLAPKWIGKGLFNTATTDQSEFGDDFKNVLPFLINRQSQAEEVALNMGDKFRQKGEKVLFGLMEAVDNFSTETIARAKYYQLTQEEGLSKEEALKETSKWCVKLFAERSKGSRATIFNSKVMSPLTQFQIEPFNQLWHWSDIHNENLRSEYRRILKENNGVLDGVDWANVENQVNKVSVSMKDLKKILGRMIALSVYGMIMRGLTGSDATWNPAGIIIDMVRGYRNDGMKGAMKAVRSNVMDNIPFSSLVEMVGNAVGLGDDEFGSTTSIPIPALSAINTAVSAIKGGTPESYLEGASYLVPGGGQMRKTAKGIQAYTKGASYNKNGKLQYPIEQNAGNAIRSALFGKNAVRPEGYEYGNVLNETRTSAYENAVERGMDQNTAYDFLMNDYKSTTKTYELASLATSDLDDADMRLMAEILGIEVDKGSIQKQAEKEVRKQIESVEKKHDKGTISEETYNQRMTDYEAFLDDLLRG